MRGWPKPPLRRCAQVILYVTVRHSFCSQYSIRKIVRTCLAFLYHLGLKLPIPVPRHRYFGFSELCFDGLLPVSIAAVSGVVALDAMLFI